MARTRTVERCLPSCEAPRLREALEERMAEGTSVGESVVMVEERLRAVRL